MAVSKKSAEDPKLLETVQMFEVITDANPDDYQSLEILKEAYSKLGREKDAVKASKRIAKIYVRLGQISFAILEYEGILQRSPDDGEALAALGELESKMPGYAAVSEPTPEQQAAERAIEAVAADVAAGEDPNEALIDFMAQQGLFPEKNRSTLVSALAAKAAEGLPGMPGPSVIDVLAERGISSVENTILFLTHATKIPFLPMETYDVDPRKAELIDRDTCIRRLVLPFDQISRTLFAVTLNPIDRQTRQMVENAAGCHVQWYITRPGDLSMKIKEVFRLNQ
ncbi:MAG: hypothetical protein JO317_06115 [Verrucomicrobiae bacterium]|nr:hypothetical protein [Verrucomicrobiae bacterium]